MAILLLLCWQFVLCVVVHGLQLQDGNGTISDDAVGHTVIRKIQRKTLKDDAIVKRLEQYKNCPIGSTVMPDKASNIMYNLPSTKANITRVAFIGDSLTEGCKSSENATFAQQGSYGYLSTGIKKGQLGFPYRLWEIFQSHNQTDKYEVLNFGFSSRHVMDVIEMMPKFQSNSYFQTCDYLRALESKAQIYVVMLGTNDILKDSEVFNHATQMKKGYTNIVRALKKLPQKPEVYLMIPPPIDWRRLPNDEAGAHLSTYWLPDLIREAAAQESMPSDHVINLQEAINPNRLEIYLADHVHPNDVGYRQIAQKVYDEIFRNRK